MGSGRDLRARMRGEPPAKPVGSGGPDASLKRLNFMVRGYQPHAVASGKFRTAVFLEFSTRYQRESGVGAAAKGDDAKLSRKVIP